MSEDRASWLGKPYREVSDMDATVATGNLIAVYGDIASAYTIVDRIGLVVELVPHLFGAARRPTGERGLFAIWRVGAVVTNANAARVLRVA